MKKKCTLLAVLVLVLITFSMVGCGGSSEKVSPDTNNSPNQSEQAPAKQTKEPRNVLDFIASVVPVLTDGEEINDVTYEYLGQNKSLFPAKTPEDIQLAQSKVNSETTIKHLNKNLEPYANQLIEVTGLVISVEETNTDYGTMSVAHIMDDTFNSIVCLYMDTTGDLLEDDYATIIGVPATAYSFENVGGGTTNAILVIGSHIIKVQ